MRNGVMPCIFATFVVLSAGAAQAQPHGRGNPSLDRILPQIREHHRGKFYDAEGPWPGPDGQLRYRLKWMTPDGRIVWFDADARSGRVLGPDSESRRDFGERRWDRGGRRPDDERDQRPRRRGGR